MLSTLQSVHQTMSITGDISQDKYLYVTAMPLLGAIALLVYKSPIVTEEFDGYEPIVRMLEDFDHEVLIQKTIPDQNMMFGAAEYSMYLLKPPQY